LLEIHFAAGELGFDIIQMDDFAPPVTAAPNAAARTTWSWPHSLSSTLSQFETEPKNTAGKGGLRD
jgi:hypothetical protein